MEKLLSPQNASHYSALNIHEVLEMTIEEARPFFEAVPALARFHAMFKDEALVLDKWFALQAGAPDRGGQVLPAVRQLMAHPDFNLRNPNRARSVIFSYCSANPGAFHRPDAAGYVFWSDRVIEQARSRGGAVRAAGSFVRRLRQAAKKGTQVNLLSVSGDDQQETAQHGRGSRQDLEPPPGRTPRPLTIGRVGEIEARSDKRY